MNGECQRLCEKLIPSAYVQQGVQARRTRENLIRHLLQQVIISSEKPLHVWWGGVAVHDVSNGSCLLSLRKKGWILYLDVTDLATRPSDRDRLFANSLSLTTVPWKLDVGRGGGRWDRRVGELREGWMGVGERVFLATASHKFTSILYFRLILLCKISIVTKVHRKQLQKVKTTTGRYEIKYIVSIKFQLAPRKQV